jgi:hypothetical protein
MPPAAPLGGRRGYFSRVAKYAFIAIALTGTAYYAYMQGFQEEEGEEEFGDDDDAATKEKEEEEEEETVVVGAEERSSAEEEEEEEEELTTIASTTTTRWEEKKPPRSPRSRETKSDDDVVATKEEEKKKKKKDGEAMEKKTMRRGFLNEKKLSSSGLFGDEDEKDEEEIEEEDDAEVVGTRTASASVSSSARKREGASTVKSPLQLVYRNIRRDLLATKSFDASAIRATRSLFHFEPFPGVGVWPVKYDDMKMFPMKSSCSRLIVLSVFDDAPSLAASGTAIVSELSKLMMSFGGDGNDEEEAENEGNAPTKVKQRPMFVCNRAQYHVTMFFFSRPIEGMTREEPVEFLIDTNGSDAERTDVAKRTDSEDEIEPRSSPPPPPKSSQPTMEKQPSIPKGLGEMVLPDKPKPRVKRSVEQNYDRVLSPPTPLSKIKPPSAISSAENLSGASTPISSTKSKFKRSASGAILDEATKAQEVLQNCESVELIVDRVVLATSGALLLCFDDVNDSLKKCRAALASNAVGVRGVQQTSTAHCTLARILPNAGDEQLSDRELKQIDQLLTKWTKRLRGAKMTCPKAWYVREQRFSSVDGDKVRLRFGLGSSRGTPP